MIELSKIRQTEAAPDAPMEIDISEKGRSAEGKQLTLDRRLLMQFVAFGNCTAEEVVKLLVLEPINVVLYQDINDSTGVGMMAYSEDEDFFLEQFRSLLQKLPNDAIQKHAMTMFGRTYSLGYEDNLEDVLIGRPVSRVVDPATPFAVWYPLRRSGLFERQPREEQRKMLMEHGGIGHAYGRAGLATDIRLAAHGLNTQDHDFIIGLLGKKLHPLSALVQHMRQTRQTSEYIESMGPFFVGKAVWQPGHLLD